MVNRNSLKINYWTRKLTIRDRTWKERPLRHFCLTGRGGISHADWFKLNRPDWTKLMFKL